MPNFPTWNPSSVTSGTTCTPTWMNSLVTNLILLQSNLRNAMGSYNSLEGYLRITVSSNKTLITTALDHDKLKQTTIGTNAHHNKIHASTHITGTNAIQLASITKKGLMQSNHVVKLKTIATGAIRNKILTTTYSGDGTSNHTINIGFAPKFMKVYAGSTLMRMYEVYQNYSFVKVHGSAAASLHYNLPTATCYVSLSNGFYAKGEMNTNTKLYAVFAIG